jgi:hypothetical protein
MVNGTRPNVINAYSPRAAGVNVEATALTVRFQCLTLKSIYKEALQCL